MDRVLIIAAHPDDEVLGCGGTIAKCCARIDDVRVAFLAEGVTARYDMKDVRSPEATKASQHRNDCAFEALSILGVANEQIFLSEHLSCRLDQEPLIDSVKLIERHIREFEPTVVYTHAAYDVNVDHRTAHWATLAAVRPTRAGTIRSVFAFEVLSSTEWNTGEPFRPTYFEDITGVIDRKVQALLAYEGEVHEAPHPRSETVVRALAIYRGAQAGVPFAEAFSLIRATAR